MNNGIPTITGKLASEATTLYAEHLQNTIARMTADPQEGDFELLALMADRLAGAVLAGPLAVALPCEFGADLWWIDDEGPEVRCWKHGIGGFHVYDDEVILVDTDGNECDLGDDTFLSKEEADNYLYCLTSADGA